MEEAEGPQLTAEHLTKRVLVINFAANYVSIVVIWLRLVLTGQLMPADFQCTSEIIMAILTRPNICSVVERNPCTLLPCGKPSVYPTASRGS